MSLVRFAAPMALLALVLFGITGTASAEESYAGIINTHVICIDPMTKAEVETLAPGHWVTVHTVAMEGFDKWDTSVWSLVGTAPAPEGNSCLVPSESVNAWSGEELNDQPFNDGPAAEFPEISPDDVLGSNVINTDNTECWSDPGSGLLTHLNVGLEVLIIADGVSDGWQLIGLESSICYVEAVYLGHPEAEESETVQQAPLIVPIETPVIVPTEQKATGGPITQLPNTGSGVEAGNPLGIFVYPAALLALILLVAAAKWSWEHKDTANQRRKAMNRYFGGRDEQ